METIRVGVIDDERKARELLIELLKQYCPMVKVIFDCDSVSTAKQEIQKHSPDLIFLDIRMPDASGFDLLLGSENPSFETVIVTAYGEYALNAFQANAIGYLVKPIVPTQLVMTVSQAIERINDKKTSQLARTFSGRMTIQGSHRIGIPTLEGILFIDIEKLLRCEADSNYTDLYLIDGKKMVVSRTLKEFEEILDSNLFLRVHKSHIINLNHIKAYQKGDKSNLTLTDGTSVPVSPQMRPALDRKLSIM